MARRHLLALTSLAVLAGLGASGWLWLTSSDSPATSTAADQRAAAARPLRIEVWGDSLTYQDGPELVAQARQRGAELDFHAFPGAPLCFWINPELANGIPRVVSRTKPDVVVLQFGGGGSSPCAEGWPPGPAAGDEYHDEGLRRVAAATASATRWLLAHGVPRVEVVGLPIRAPVLTTLLPRDEAMRGALRRGVRAVGDRRVTYLDPSPSLEDASGRFAATLPCLPEELRTPGRCNGPVLDGVASNVVRASDGLHLCDVTWPEQGPAPAPGCPGGSYSSGAYRLAKAILAPLLRPSPR